MTIVRNMSFALGLALSMAAPAAATEGGCEAGETVLRFSVVTALEGHPKGEAAMAFAEMVNEQLNGRYCVEVYGNAELYDDNDELFAAMVAGEVHFAAPSMSKLGSFTDVFMLFDLPFLFDTGLHAMEFFDSEAAQAMFDEVRDDGLEPMGFWSNGMRHFSATVPMRLPGDAAGLKFRVQSGSPIMAAMLDVMGVEAVSLPFSQVYENLADGTVQGQENSWSNIYTKGFYLEQAATTETNHLYLGYLVLTTTGFMDGLEADARKIIEDAMALTTHERNRFAFEINQSRRQDIIDDDGVIIELTPDEIQAWRDAFAPVFASFRDTIGGDLIDEAVRINAEADPFN